MGAVLTTQKRLGELWNVTGTRAACRKMAASSPQPLLRGISAQFLGGGGQTSGKARI